MVRSTAPLVERMALVWHDWFATQRVGGIPQKGMIDQNELFREHAWARSRSCSRTSRRTRRAALAQQRPEHGALAERELRPRADGAVHPRRQPRLHRGRHPRAGARSPAGAAARAERARTSSTTTALHDESSKTVFGRGATSTGETPHGSPRAPIPSFFVPKLWSYFVPTAPPAAVPGARVLTPPTATRTARCRGHPEASRALQRAAMVEPPRSTSRASLRALGRGLAGANWADLGAVSEAAALPPAERCRLGRLALAGHVDLPAAAGSSPAPRCASQRRPRRLRRASALVTRAAAQPRRSHADRTDAHGRDAARARPAQVELAAGGGPGGSPAVTLAPGADQLMAVRRACACNSDFGRLARRRGRRCCPRSS